MHRFSKETRPRHPGQQGSVLICTAFLLPVLFFLGGITVDFGSAYLAKSTLQNAADAAALAGGHEYLDSGRNVRSTKASAEKSAQTNYSRTDEGHTTRLKEVSHSGSFPDDTASIHIDTDAHDDYVDVRLRQKVQLPFFGMLGGLLNIGALRSMNIQAASRAHLVTTGGTGPFDYTVFGAATSRWTKNDEKGNAGHKQFDPSGSADQPANNPELASVVFKGNPNNPYKLNGNIGGNGRIGFNNANGTNYNFQLTGANGINEDGISRIDTSSLYGTANADGYNTDKDKRFLFSTPQGASCGPTNSTYKTRINTPPLDISFNAQNPITKDLYAFYQEVRALCQSDLAAAEQKGWYCDDTTPASESYQFDAGGLTWYQGNLRWGQDLNPLGVQCNSNNIYKHSASLRPDQERFRVIIVNGDVTINMEKTANGDKLHGWDMNEMYCDKDGDGQDHENYAVIISLHGNIRMHNYSKFRGIIFAPEGEVWLDAYDRIYGNIVGQRVKIDNQNYDVEAGPFLTQKNYQNVPHLNSRPTTVIRLESL